MSTTAADRLILRTIKRIPGYEPGVTFTPIDVVRALGGNRSPGTYRRVSIALASMDERGAFVERVENNRYRIALRGAGQQMLWQRAL